MTASASPIMLALRDPTAMPALSLSAWDEALRALRNAGLLSRVAARLSHDKLDVSLPDKVRDHLTAASVIAGQHERVIRWEVSRIRKALRPVNTKVVLLKGAAYLMLGLPNSRGRLVTDVDIMVPKARLRDAEQALIASGFESMKLDAYDQRYYRTWMHELPPLRHRTRGSVLDVHHTILPETGRLRPNPDKLLESARRIEGDELYTLCPHDMVLHSAVHLFQDGDFAGGLRDLIDLDLMMRHFAAHEPGFWAGLVPRAQELTLQRPLFYALRFARRIFDTPVPDDVIEASRVGAPPAPVMAMMDVLIGRALMPRDPGRSATLTAGIAQWLLYVRSHWLRMPPGLLARHLTRKALRRVGGDGAERR